MKEFVVERGVYDFAHKLTDPREDALSRHMHNAYEILYLARGEAEYVIEGAVYRLRPRTLLLIRPRRFHYLRPLQGNVYERFVIHFPDTRIPEKLRTFVEEAPEIVRVREDSIPARLFSTWQSAEEKYSDADLAVLLETALPQILLGLKYGAEEPVLPRLANPTLDAILRYIDEHPDEALSAADLSRRFFVSTSWIVHGFREHLGITLMQYVNRKRILYAEEKIRAGASPTAVAKACHYDSYVTFYRQFKKYLGYPPNEATASFVSKPTA